MQKQNGFTLVELVVVIIILGILAVTAAPKFINMQSDARLSTLQGVKGAINGANVMIYAKASLDGKNKAASEIISLDSKHIVSKADSSSQTPKADTSDSSNTRSSVPTSKPNTAVVKADIAAAPNANQVSTAYGYVKATKADLQKAADLSGDDWEFGTPSNDSITIKQKNAPTECKLTYTQATASGALPKFTMPTDASKC